MLEVQVYTGQFNDWQELLNLLHGAFAFQNNRINPPSSLHQLNVQSIAEKAQQETLLLAFIDKQLVGCLFARKQADHSLYIGKQAVLPTQQGKGIGSTLMREIEKHALTHSYTILELQVRVELTENLATFKALGFTEHQRTSHPGFDTITSITMRKELG